VAAKRAKGAFELAHAARYFFLDEIGDVSPPRAIALLRALENATIERIGSDRRIALDVLVNRGHPSRRWPVPGSAPASFVDDLY